YWMTALRARTPVNAPASKGLAQWIGKLKSMDNLTLAQAEKEVGNLFSIADNLLHQAAGIDRSFDPTWSDTAMNAVRSVNQAVTTATEPLASLAKDASKGLSWTLLALPILALVGVGIFALTKGGKD
ncbi:MAG: hypothetical protein HQL86_06995, partial [Magnetococcales bacterium]|nr:hypothetical protein [Magnetococcales bacterium]